MPIECEFKWKAHNTEDFSRMLGVIKKYFTGHITGPANILNQDAYLDTPQQLWSAHKTALRIRCANGRFEATAKSQTKMMNGKAVRQEETLSLHQAHNLPQALELLKTKSTWLGLPLAGVQMIFTITNRRQTYQLTSGADVYELALDDCLLEVAGRCKELKEIELELKKGNEEAFSLFAGILQKNCGLSVPEKSKVESARALLEENK